MKSVEATKFRGHIRALDGLRGVAILLVLMIHFYMNGGSNVAEGPISGSTRAFGSLVTKVAMAGATGVPLFFVLSGFLITGILLDSRRNPNYFKAFYMRRFLRIFPLYYSTLCIILFILPSLLTFAADAQGVVSRQVWLWTYLSNTPWAGGGFQALAGSPGGGWDADGLFRLGHFWSLCVEEHFYILWPLVVYSSTDRGLATICIGGFTASVALGIMHSMPGCHPLLNWTTLTTMHGLFVGSLIALGLRVESINHFLAKHTGKAAMTFGMVFMGTIFFPGRLRGVWWWAFCQPIYALFYGALLIEALSAKGRLASILESSFLCKFGKFSYGIYVIHMVFQPTFERCFGHAYLLSPRFGHPWIGQLVFYALSISSSYLLAVASWHLLEKHFLSLKRFFEYQPPAKRATV